MLQPVPLQVQKAPSSHLTVHDAPGLQSTSQAVPGRQRMLHPLSPQVTGEHAHFWQSSHARSQVVPVHAEHEQAPPLVPDEAPPLDFPPLVPLVPEEPVSTRAS